MWRVDRTRTQRGEPLGETLPICTMRTDSGLCSCKAFESIPFPEIQKWLRRRPRTESGRVVCVTDHQDVASSEVSARFRKARLRVSKSSCATAASLTTLSPTERVQPWHEMDICEGVEEGTRDCREKRRRRYLPTSRARKMAQARAVLVLCWLGTLAPWEPWLRTFNKDSQSRLSSPSAPRRQ